jgi:hypothetical protein
MLGHPVGSCQAQSFASKLGSSAVPGSRQQGRVENKVENSEKFSATKKRQSTNHNSPQFHHEFTIKKPRKNARFSKNPLQKHHFTTPGKKPLSILVGNPNLH